MALGRRMSGAMCPRCHCSIPEGRCCSLLALHSAVYTVQYSIWGQEVYVPRAITPHPVLSCVQCPQIPLQHWLLMISMSVSPAAIHPVYICCHMQQCSRPVKKQPVAMACCKFHLLHPLFPTLPCRPLAFRRSGTRSRGCRSA
jgi:hypothetical protein